MERFWFSGVSWPGAEPPDSQEARRTDFQHTPGPREMFLFFAGFPMEPTRRVRASNKKLTQNERESILGAG